MNSPNSEESTAGPESPPQAWYPDPGGSGKLRWWDGTGWTERLTEQPTKTEKPEKTEETVEAETGRRFPFVDAGHPRRMIAVVLFGLMALAAPFLLVLQSSETDRDPGSEPLLPESSAERSAPPTPAQSPESSSTPTSAEPAPEEEVDVEELCAAARSAQQLRPAAAELNPGVIASYGPYVEALEELVGELPEDVRAAGEEILSLNRQYAEIDLTDPTLPPITPEVQAAGEELAAYLEEAC